MDGIRNGLHDTHRDGLYRAILLLLLLLRLLLLLLLMLMLLRRRLGGVKLSGRMECGWEELHMNGDGYRLRGRHLDYVVVRHHRDVVDDHLALGVVEGDRLDEVRLGRPGERRNEWSGPPGSG